MRIAWVGWNGPSMNEFSKGVEQFDPNVQRFIVGNHDRDNEGQAEFYKTTANRVIMTSPYELLEELKAFDVIFYDTYGFAIGHRPEIYSYLPGGCAIAWGQAPVELANYPEWKDLKAYKILFDGESAANQLEYYQALASQFDYVFTYNDKLNSTTYPIPVDETIFVPGNKTKDIDILYTGDNLDKGYRSELFDYLKLVRIEYNIFTAQKQDLDSKTWLEALQRSKIYLCTYSCASGDKYPMHEKGKEYAALLCGALPVTELFDGTKHRLEFGIEKVGFDGLDSLPSTLEYYLEHPDAINRIATNGQNRVLSSYTLNKVFKDLFKACKLIP